MFYIGAPKQFPLLVANEYIWATGAFGMFFYSVQVSTDKNLIHFDICLAVGSR